MADEMELHAKLQRLVTSYTTALSPSMLIPSHRRCRHRSELWGPFPSVPVQFVSLSLLSSCCVLVALCCNLAYQVRVRQELEALCLSLGLLKATAADVGPQVGKATASWCCAAGCCTAGDMFPQADMHLPNEATTCCEALQQQDVVCRGQHVAQADMHAKSGNNIP